jgi:SNF2 family DNA or RNA helicase
MTEKTNTVQKKVPYHFKPADMSVEEWQVALRRQFAEKQNFSVKNEGNHPVFSDFAVFNPISGNEYKVAIRSKEFGMNFCSCPDFKINELGTCKHIEFVLHQLNSVKKNDVYWISGPDLAYSSLSLKYGKERKIILRVGTVNAEDINRIAVSFFDDNFLKEEAFYFVESFIELVKQYDPDFRVYDDALEYIIQLRDKNQRIAKIHKKYPDGIDSKHFDTILKTELYPYQKQGVLFAAKAGRVLIADDMGLGKTIQAIAAVELLAKEAGVSNALIICPTSLKYQWKSEITKFTDRDIIVIEGHLDKRKDQYQSSEFYKIASYGVALNDIDYLNKMAPDLVILDEAQRIKNWKTKTAQNIKKIKSDFALVLTGTPLENRLDELHSLVEFVDNYKLGSLFRFLDNHQIYDETGKVIGYDNLNKISETLKDVLIRRHKKEILKQIPERTDKNYFVDITKEQYEIHEDYKNTVARLINKWKRHKFLSEKDRQRLLISLNCMRMVSDSTYILDQKTRHDTKIDELLIILKEIFESGDDKVVIFSQWERMTRLVSRELDQMEIGYEYLHGGVPSAKRKDLIDNFTNKVEKRVFLSTDAGGVGLNLQAASVVINLDIPWNPAVLEQRIARVHRLGQHKSVRVINLISKGTIELRILELLGFKQSLFDGVLDGGEDKVLMGESKFNKFMKSVEIITESTTNKHKEVFTENKEDFDFRKENIEVAQINQSVAKEITDSKKTAESKENNGIDDLVSTALDFMHKFGNTMTDIQTGKINVSSFLEKDENGKASLKIPVKDEESLVKSIGSIAEILKAFGK